MIDTFKDRLLLYLTNKQMQMIQEQDYALNSGGLNHASKVKIQSTALSELSDYIKSGALDESK